MWAPPLSERREPEGHGCIIDSSIEEHVVTQGPEVMGWGKTRAAAEPWPRGGAHHQHEQNVPGHLAWQDAGDDPREKD